MRTRYMCYEVSAEHAKFIYLINKLKIAWLELDYDYGIDFYVAYPMR